jgi:3-deoxy-D-manno-octulosonate 8-phosphate phosphatase (KDO 8-P phosphatase)
MSASTQCTDGLQALQAIAFDVDGVLTDGTILWGPNGEEWKRFSFPDIMGISLARRLGIHMALISGESSPLVDRYAEKMRIEHVVKDCRDKAAALRDFATATGIPLTGICFFGDDINDLSAMEIAGLCACPASANDAVLDHVSKHGFIAKHSGGRGAVRDLIDAILKARNLDPKAVFQLSLPE